MVLRSPIVKTFVKHCIIRFYFFGFRLDVRPFRKLQHRLHRRRYSSHHGRRPHDPHLPRRRQCHVQWNRHSNRSWASPQSKRRKRRNFKRRNDGKRHQNDIRDRRWKFSRKRISIESLNEFLFNVNFILFSWPLSCSKVAPMKQNNNKIFKLYRDSLLSNVQKSMSQARSNC